MNSGSTEWYGCRACGEARRFPFDANGDDPGCRCPPAEWVLSAELEARSPGSKVVDPDRRARRLRDRDVATPGSTS